MRKRYFFGALLLSCLLLSAGAAASDAVEGVDYGREVYIHPTGVLFMGWENTLVSALIGEDGTPYEFVSEGTFPYRINGVCISGDYLYLATEDGVYRVLLSESSQDVSAAQKVCEDSLSNGFSIYDGYLYYRYGYSLYRVSVEGGEKEQIIQDINDAEVTNRGIYCMEQSGRLSWLSFDGYESKRLCDAEEKSHMSVSNGVIYFWGEDEDEVGCYSIADDGFRQMEVEEDISTYCLWAAPDYLIYDDNDFEAVRRYDFSTGREERLSEIRSIPYKEEGYFYNGILYRGN